MKTKNLKEFKKLIERYEKITLEEIEQAFDTWHFPQEKLTGFGNVFKCTLCENITKLQGEENADIACAPCVYKFYTQARCCVGINRKSYDSIYKADNAKALLKAYRERAKHMRSILNNK